MSSYRRDRPQVNVIALGHAGSGKTSLAAAMTRVMAERPDATRTRVRTVDDIVRRPGPSASTSSVRTVVLGYETPARWVLHADPPGAVKRVRTLPRSLPGCDAAVLVVAADVGVMPQTREHLYWARAAGIERAVVFVNKCDAVTDHEQLELVEHESRDALSAAGFAGDEATVLRGSAARALEGDPVWSRALDELADVLDHEVPQPSRDESGPVIAQVETLHRPRAAGSGQWFDCVSAYVRRGTIRRGDILLLSARGGQFTYEVKDLEIDNAKVSQGVAGDLLGMLLRPRERDLVARRRILRRGPLLLAPNTPELVTAFTASVSLLTQKQGGRHTDLFGNALLTVVVGGVSVAARLVLPEELKSVAPGGSVSDARFTLQYPTRIVPGMGLVLRDGCDGLRRALGGPPRWSGTCGLGVVRSVG